MPMTRILLDTHLLIWALDESGRSMKRAGCPKK